MAKAKQPVDIDGITFDALIEENRTLSADVPAYPVEEGFEVSDSIILQPETIDMTLYVTNTPVTWIAKHGVSMSRVQDVLKQLEEKYFAKEPVTITTSDNVYENMAIISIGLTKNFENSASREIPISFQQIRVTERRTATIPASYGRGGQTGTNAGTANTAQSGTPAPSASASASQDSNSGGDGSRGSILYGLANGAGLGGGGGVGGLVGGLLG